MLLVLLTGCLFQPTPYVPPDVQELDPELTMASPAAGSYVDAGAVTVEGTAIGYDTVLLNGEAVAVSADGSYAHTLQLLPGVTSMELLGTDADGDERFIRQSVLAGQFGDPDQMVSDGAVVRLNQPALNRIVESAELAIDASTLEASAMAMNPVYEQNIGILNVNANLTNLEFDDVQLMGDPTTGALRVFGTVPNVVADLSVTGGVFFEPFDATVHATATSVEITADVLISAVSGKPVVQVSSADATVIGMQTESEGLPLELDSGLITGALEGALETMLPTMITNQVPGLIQTQLDTLDLNFPLNIIGVPVDIAAEWGRVDIDNDGVVIGLDLDIEAPTTGDAGTPGYLTGAGAPTLSRSSDVSVGLSDDLVNLLLFRAWQADGLVFELDTDALAAQDVDGSLAMIGDGTVHVDPALPPVVVEREGNVQAMIGELGVRLDTPEGGFGQTIEIAAAVTSPVDLGVLEEDVVLALGDADVSLGTRYNDWGAVDNEAMTRMLEVAVPIESVMSVFSDIIVPVPQLQGIDLLDIEIDRDAAGRHTTLEMSIE